MGAIAAAGGYFTPQELYLSLKETQPGIGLVTVYRTLAVLARAGLICRIESTGKSRCYARRKPLSHHHHLVCEGCARVVDFSNCDLTGLAEKLASDTGFVINAHSLEFQGLCRECGKSAKPPSVPGGPETG